QRHAVIGRAADHPVQVVDVGLVVLAVVERNRLRRYDRLEGVLRVGKLGEAESVLCVWHGYLLITNARTMKRSCAHIVASHFRRQVARGTAAIHWFRGERFSLARSPVAPDAVTGI